MPRQRRAGGRAVVVATVDHKSTRPDRDVFHRTSLALFFSRVVLKLLLDYLIEKRAFSKGDETMVFSPEVDTVMERVLVVFFKGVFLTSVFLMQMLVLSFARQSSNFLPLLMFQRVYALICAIISALLFSFRDTVRPNNHQTDAFSLGMSAELISDRQGYFLIIYLFIFLCGDLDPSKTLTGFLPVC